RLNPAKNHVPWVADVWAGGGVTDLAVMDGVIYALSGRGEVRRYEADTGKPFPPEKDFTPLLTVAELGPIGRSDENTPLHLSPQSGSFRIRSHITLGVEGGGLTIRAGGQIFPLSGLRPGKEVTVEI